MAVSEDKVPGEEVGRLKARDPDLAENGLVDYRILEGDGMNYFEISKDSETQEAVIKLKKVKCVRAKKASGKDIHKKAMSFYVLCNCDCERNCVCCV